MQPLHLTAKDCIQSASAAGNSSTVHAHRELQNSDRNSTQGWQSDITAKTELRLQPFVPLQAKMV